MTMQLLSFLFNVILRLLTNLIVRNVAAFVCDGNLAIVSATAKVLLADAFPTNGVHSLALIAENIQIVVCGGIAHTSLVKHAFI